MRLFRNGAASAPPDAQGWESQLFGFSAGEVRFWTYGGILLLLFANGLGLYFYGTNYLADFRGVRQGFGAVGVISVVVGFGAALCVIHELIHVFWFPDRGLSRNTLVGVLPWAFFVLYNAAITPRDMVRSVRMPLVILTPPLVVLALIYPGSLTVNALLVHVLSCGGDVLLLHKLSKLRNVDAIWSSGTAVWFKFRDSAV